MPPVKMRWRCRNHQFDLGHQGEIMGILNVTPDSFSDGGRFTGLDAALEQAALMIEEGAAIIDVGGESTRPGAAIISETEELERTIPVIQELTKQYPNHCLSIDTSKPKVARKAIESGASIINDVTGFMNPAMIDVASETGVGLIAMHMQGTPDNMQNAPTYRDVVTEVRTYFQGRFQAMVEANIDPQSIVFDPGIGFGKTLDHNLELIGRLDDLVVEGRPILLGVSRKSFIGALLDSTELSDRSWPTVAITAFATEKGAPLHRVHEVEKNLHALRMTEAIRAS